MADDFVVKYAIDFDEDEDTGEPYAVIVVDGIGRDEGSGVPIPLDAVEPLLSALKEFVASKRKKTVFKDGRKVHDKVTLKNHAYGVDLKCGRKSILLEPPGIPFLIQDIAYHSDSWQE